MQEFVSLLVDNLDLVLSVVVGLLCFLVTILRTGSVKKAIKNLKEYQDMIKYRTAEKAQAEKQKCQEFSETIPDYILDPVSNELKASPLPKDVQAEIQSFIDVALDRALEKFLPKDVQDVDDVVDYTQHSQDLSVMGEAFELAEQYREKYNLGDKMSVAEIYDFVGQQADKLKNDLLKYEQSKKEGANNGKSEEKETK